MTPSPPKVMPKAMQIEMLKKFVHDCEIDIDWEHDVDATLSLPENRVELSLIYPQCKWFTDKEEMRGVKKQALDDLSGTLDYMLSIVPPEAKEDFREVFDDYLSRYRYALERKLKISGVKRRVKELEIELEEAKKTREITPERPPTVRTPPTPRPLRWTKELERKLRDIFEATFTREGLSPRKYLPEYRVELEEVIKGLPTEEEMKKAVEELAKEIIRRVRVPSVKPPVIRPPRPPGLPPGPPVWREEEIEPWPYAAPPIWPPTPISDLPFPRRPSGSEIDQIWELFTFDLRKCGLYRPEQYRSTFTREFRETTFTSWAEMERAYDLLVERLCAGLPPRIKAEFQMLPYTSLDRGVYWVTWLQTLESAEEIAIKLTEMGTPITEEEVRILIKKGWQEKDWQLRLAPREYLERLIGESLE